MMVFALTQPVGQCGLAKTKHCAYMWLFMTCFKTTLLSAQVGDPGLTIKLQRSQFVLRALLKLPLLIGADFRTLGKEAKHILTAPDVIAIIKDPLGIAGDLVWKYGPLEVCIPWHCSDYLYMHAISQNRLCRYRSCLSKCCVQALDLHKSTFAKQYS